MKKQSYGWLASLALTVLAACSHLPHTGRYLSHPPMRPLPHPSRRPLPDTPVYFVNPSAGDDSGPGSRATPWRTVAHSVKQLAPGDTLCLRGGIYYENVVCSPAGSSERPITIRSFPGELAVIDGGFREFFERPAEAWLPFGGVDDEYISARTYPEPAAEARRNVAVLGNFGDSMVPLHGYHTALDLQAKTAYATAEVSTDKKKEIRSIGFYCGPGIWWNPQTHRIHARLAHTRVPELGSDDYRGETDPRQLPLVIAGTHKNALRIENAAHLLLQDIAVRGARVATVVVQGSRDVTFDHVTIFGGSPALHLVSNERFTLSHSAVRGIAAPWSSRSSMKYYGASSYLVWCDSATPLNSDIDFAYCEFTDNHDGLFIGPARNLKLHHSLVDNFNDDGIYITSTTPEAGPLIIMQNRLRRSLSMLSQYGKRNDPTGKGVWVARNVIELRPIVHYSWYTGPGSEILTRGRVWGEHGGPTWEPIAFYQNTVISQNNRYGGYYGAGWGGHLISTRARRVHNNIFMQVEKNPGLAFTRRGTFNPTSADAHFDGNLHWSTVQGPTTTNNPLDAFRASQMFEDSKRQYAPGWMANDLFAAPRFTRFRGDWHRPSDLRLQSTSPAVNTGVPIPDDWPDPLRTEDDGAPDMGALPLGVPPRGVGIDGRLSLFGD